jgi:hypothetical protein
MRFEKDSEDGLSSTGGTGGGPAILKRQYIAVTWAWPSNVANPSGFEVVIYIGTDPTATDTYVVPPQKCLGTDRHLQVTVSPSTNLTDINAAVRALYE